MVFFENALENAFIDKELKSIKGIDIQKEQSNSREEKAEKSRK